MLKNIPRSGVRKLKSLTKKIYKQRKNLHIIFVIKSKNALRPHVMRARRFRDKVLYAAKLVLDRREREIYVLLKQAEAHDDASEWKLSAESWKSAADKFNTPPVRLIAQQAYAHVQLGQYDRAMQIVNNAIRLVEPNEKGDFTDADLQRLLKLSRAKSEIFLAVKISSLDEYNRGQKSYLKSGANKKLAVVTAIAGGYDALRPITQLDSRVDYIVFADQAVRAPEHYKVLPLPYVDSDTTRSARYVKTNLTKLLPGYDYIVWIDANIFVTGDLGEMLDTFIGSGLEFSAMLHPTRVSPYEEMEECIRKGKDDIEAIAQQRDFYMSEGYHTEKLIESNILFVRNTDTVDDFMGLWWNQIDKYSRRDQLSINYCLDRCGVNWGALMERPMTSRNHPSFALVDHGKGSTRFKEFIHEIAPHYTDPFTVDVSTTIKPSAHRKKAHSSVTAVVCVHNAREDVEICLESIKKHRLLNLDLIIIDDGSEKATKEYLEQFYNMNKAWVQLIRHAKAKGYTKSASEGLSKSNADLTVLLNSDTIVTNNWSEKMLALVNNNKGVGIVGPLSSAASTQSIPNFESTKDQTAINSLPESLDVNDMNGFCERAGNEVTAVRVPLIHGFCFGVTRDVIRAIGVLDYERFPRGYGEENDYCFRAADAGFSLAVATDTYVFHSKSKSFVDDERKKLMQDGARAFRDKHGQRRITRAVETMKANPYLVRIRKEAELLYAKQLLLSSPVDREEIVHLPENFCDMRMAYFEKSNSLQKLNEKLINWESLSAKGYNDKLVSIVVLVYGELEMTKRCIRSILAAKTEAEYEIIIVHNGSGIQTMVGLRSLLNEAPGARLIQIERNTNFALGNNLGFQYASGAKTVFINNDTYVTDGWLDVLVQELDNEGVLYAQPTLLYPDSTVQSLGVAFSPVNALAHAAYAHGSVGVYRKIKKSENIRRLRAVTGACLAIHSRDFAAVNGFDPIYINGQEDVDLCLRLNGMHLNIRKPGILALESVVYHDESKTPGRGKYVFDNRATFLNRWGGKTVSDSEEMYAGDGYSVQSWRPDSRDMEIDGIAIYSPRLKRR